MIAIPGYETLTQIYDGSRTEVYRGQRSFDQKPVVLKLLKSGYPSFSELVQFRNQYTISKNLDLPGIIKPIALENYRNGFVLVMEDFGGISLKEYAAEKPLNVGEFLRVAIAIVQTLEGLYHNRIIHKDIKPQNILINPETKQVKLIDFSIASLLPRESQEIQSPNVLEGTLAYMSPEQTGRMNRAIDYRTDFYSLGVTFYELLTGELPFQSNDLMELVHCHIARQPTPPIEVNPGIPQVVSEIVMKLMAKTAEDRYQSAYGLRCDLENCWQQWQENRHISQFPLAKKDITERFVIPEKLYGRETEVQTLLAGFVRVASPKENRVSAGAIEMMLVTGFSGIGKTAIVNEVHKPIVRQRGYFIKGKFDQFKRDIPFSAWVQAFQNLMRQLLAESAESVQNWKNLILEALGDNSQVIIDVIPELELLIDRQSPATELQGTAAQNRFNLLFQKFIRVLATEEHPLVIFLDDLQWADLASLKLMQLLMSESQTRHLLLIGAYRDNEVTPAHPLILTLDEIRQTEATVNQIILAPLDRSSLNCLIADTLSCPPERAVPLTELVLQKTKGNPFFSNQFLKSLHQDGLISFDFKSGYWQCDIAKVRAIAVSEDVVEFMASQLQKLPENTQEVLKLAACIGNSFDLASLAIVRDRSQTETAADMWRALQEGLILPQSEVYKFFSNNGAESLQLPITNYQLPKYKFLHDRVQQAAYSLIPVSQKQLTHLKIGRLLLSNIPVEEREENIFDIVNQLNYGLELIEFQTERYQIAELNLISGNKAKASTAYAAALRYLTIGIGLLAASSWESHYELTLALHNQGADAAYLSADFEQMERLAQMVLQRGKTLLDKVKVYEVKIQAYVAQNQPMSAIETALGVLDMLGVNFPKKPSLLDIELNLEEVKLNLTGKRIEDLIELPSMTDPLKQAAMHIITSIISPAYIAVPELMPLLAFKLVNLSIEHGNAPASAIGYVMYGLILCSAVEIEDGYQLGKLALDLLERLDAKQFQCKTIFLFNDLIKAWKESVRSTLKPLRSAYYIGLETGDIEYAAWSAYQYAAHSYLSGNELGEVDREMTSASEGINKLQQETSLNYLKMFHQSVLNLMGSSENPCQLIGRAYDREKMLPIHQSSNDKNATYVLYLNQLLLCYWLGEYALAIENAAKAEEDLKTVPGLVIVPIFHLYDSLSRLAVYLDATASERSDILAKVIINQEKMEKWANYAPMNFLHKFYLVEAERYRILGENVEAMEMYDRAIAGAKENEYIQEEALAHELAAEFYLAWGKEIIAQTYLTNAYYAYARWGAKAKVEDLEKRYPQLLAPIFNREKRLKSSETFSTTATRTVTSSSGKGTSAVLDLAAVIKASQALSGEIQLDKLLATLMQVAIANAGATSGAFILEQAGELIVFAQCSSIETCNLQSAPLSSSQEIPASPINYVWRTRETLVINDVTTQTTFAADPYIIQQQPQSILCTPIQSQGKAIGILYLENNLTVDAFTPDRLEILKVLSSQAAISMENSRLYANLEEYNRSLETKVSERTRELSKTLNELKITQEELIQSEKMAALGQLIAGVAHEINTPLGAIRSSVGNISTFLRQTLEELPTLFQTLSPEQRQEFLALLQRSLQKNSTITTKEARQYKRALIGQLEAEEIGDADTIADTLVDMGIYNEIQDFLPMLKRPDSSHILETAYNLSELQRSTQTIETATERASKVVFALKSYGRYDQSAQIIPANLTDGIETVLTLYHNPLKQGVEVLRNYAELPLVLCYPDELNQVWTNLVHNALQAMDYRGTLTIEVMQQDQQAKISFTDSGKGIPPEIMPKIFEPFFTTKPAGEGSGLGLHIVKKIIDKHYGKIAVESQPGRTTFEVFLPIQPSQETGDV